MVIAIENKISNIFDSVLINSNSLCRNFFYRIARYIVGELQKLDLYKQFCYNNNLLSKQFDIRKQPGHDQLYNWPVLLQFHGPKNNRKLPGECRLQYSGGAWFWWRKFCCWRGEWNDHWNNNLVDFDITFRITRSLENLFVYIELDNFFFQLPFCYGCNN